MKLGKSADSYIVYILVRIRQLLKLLLAYFASLCVRCFVVITNTTDMCSMHNIYTCHCIGKEYIIIESVDSISKDERGFPLTQYITNGRISRGGYTFTHFKHYHRVLRLISYRMSV